MKKISINKSSEAIPKIWGLRTAPFWVFIGNSILVLYLVFSNISWLGLFLGLSEIGIFYLGAAALSDPALINSLFHSSFPKSIKNDLF